MSGACICWVGERECEIREEGDRRERYRARGRREGVGRKNKTGRRGGV